MTPPARCDLCGRRGDVRQLAQAIYVCDRCMRDPRAVQFRILVALRTAQAATVSIRTWLRRKRAEGSPLAIRVLHWLSRWERRPP